jgi:TRAP-type mannitol/chloroaromatic compound transport system permease large subunit
MMRYGYDMRIATGVIAASGTITQVIPPSLVLIVLGDVLGKSVGDMYAGAIGPSFLQTFLFLAYIALISIIAPHRVPPLPPEALVPRGWSLWWRVLRGMVPSLVLIFMVLGTIFLGCCARRWATPCASPPWCCSSWSARRCSAWSSRAWTAGSGSSTCSPTCPAARPGS